MERVVIIEELKKIIKPYVNEKEAVESLAEETDFINDLKINSANLVDIILDIEDAFAIVIDDKSMEQILNIKSAIDIIEIKLKES
jgi:acyl carrier protein